MKGTKELRYYVMLALYFPILLYAFSTFDLSEETFAVQGIEPLIVGEQTVVLGQPFQARAFLVISEGQGQELEGSEQLEVVGDSVFQMATGQLLEEDENEKTVAYSGTFRFQQLGGSVESFPVEGAFKVRRPEIIAAAEATQTLYRQCRNSIRIDVPGLEDRTLRLQTGGSSVTGRTLTLSPGGEQVGVRVFLADSARGDVYLGSKQFAVIDPPRPEIQVLNAGREISNGQNIPKQRAVLEFQVQPDEEFKRRFPQDARYSIGRATVYLRKGLVASQEVGTFNLDGGKTLQLTRVLRDAQPGDRLLIRLERVVRINHAGSAIPVPFSEASRTFGFTVS
jgi:hypothetical protein